MLESLCYNIFRRLRDSNLTIKRKGIDNYVKRTKRDAPIRI